MKTKRYIGRIFLFMKKPYKLQTSVTKKGELFI